MNYFEGDKVQIREAWSGLEALLGKQGTVVYTKKDRSQPFYLVRMDGVEKDFKMQRDLRSHATNKTDKGFDWKADLEKQLQVPLLRCITRHLTLVSRPSRPASGAASGAASVAAGKRPFDEGEDPKGKRPKQ